ncbi:hypothetical protein [Knoellia subterranea]|uniref:Peptidase S1 domain-containing protein n=1 Tax=Knoellia subterranea KCTC 19937 TaxID=1385521 RepID=A0A0A0JMD5_9MICO|nr:hypothetical protein [Knoellia subterranea]KGN37222.1 hypothetical protein N803_15365 [Knoellia subterranea KCTC 19937]
MATQHEQAAQRAAIRPVKESVEDELLAKPGVVAVDIAEKETDGRKTGEQSIVVFVEQKKPTSKLSKGAAIPREIDGIKTDVQELVIELQPAYKPVDAAELLVDTGDYPTLAGGIGIGPRRSVFLSPPDVPAPGNYVFVGTLGAMVRDRTSGATMALTNFHVACVNNTWSVGDRQVQPSLVDGGAPTGEFGSLTRAALSENIDGAVITVDASEPWTATVTGIGGVAGSTAATVGMAVQKRGRTTEHTFGTVASTDFTVTVNYGSDVGSRTLRHQIRIDTDTSRNPRFSDHGDSGSVVQDMSRNVVGLLFAGSNDGSMTFANPIQAALDELDVDLLTAPVLTVTRPILSCFNTRITVCLKTRTDIGCMTIKTKIPALCPTLVTKPAICDFVTRPATCAVTKIPICDLEFTRPGCTLPTRACGGEFERPPIEEWSRGGGGFGYGTSATEVEAAADEAYWGGYLAALEELDALDSEGTGSGSGSGGGA